MFVSETILSLSLPVDSQGLKAESFAFPLSLWKFAKIMLGITKSFRKLFTRWQNSKAAVSVHCFQLQDSFVRTQPPVLSWRRPALLHKICLHFSAPVCSWSWNKLTCSSERRCVCLTVNSFRKNPKHLVPSHLPMQLFNQRYTRVRFVRKGPQMLHQMLSVMLPTNRKIFSEWPHSCLFWEKYF